MRSAHVSCVTFPMGRLGPRWVWIGNAEVTDESKIPVMSWCSDSKWVFEGSTYHVKCDSQLLVDNIVTNLMTPETETSTW